MQPEVEKSAWKTQSFRRKEAKKVLRMEGEEPDGAHEPKWLQQETAKDTGESWKQQLNSVTRSISH